MKPNSLQSDGANSPVMHEVGLEFQRKIERLKVEFLILLLQKRLCREFSSTEHDREGISLDCHGREFSAGQMDNRRVRNVRKKQSGCLIDLFHLSFSGPRFTG